MTQLSFSEFVQILYPFCGYGATEAEYIITLTNKIMEGQPGRALKGDKYQNPMKSKSPRTLQAYFKGTRPISKSDACILFAHSDTYKFEEYLRYQCSEGGQKLLKAQMERRLEQEIANEKFDIVAFCADLFVDILFRLASGNID